MGLDLVPVEASGDFGTVLCHGSFLSASKVGSKPVDSLSPRKERCLTVLRLTTATTLN